MVGRRFGAVAAAFAFVGLGSTSGCAYVLREPVQDVTVSSNVASARITVDGAPVVPGPMKLARAKAHAIVATAEGYPPARVNVEPSTSVGPLVADIFLAIPTFGTCFLYDFNDGYGAPIKALSPDVVTIELAAFDQEKAKKQSLAGAVLTFETESSTTTIRIGSNGRVESMADQGKKDAKPEPYEVSRFGKYVAEDGGVVVEIVASRSAAVDQKFGGGLMTLHKSLTLACNVETNRFNGNCLTTLTAISTGRGGRESQYAGRPDERAVEGKIERGQ